ncbi:iron-dicitrate transporter subunit ATP-binding component of ABC superfamily; KpLE2 phage-like element [Candidatus Methylomirabilis lanthanidiphila]|uniref:Iron-dicitrate transporter subunit ATP-binding component of ABC superfamily KpLE2 phage-like element n=1 Tax=Candidatus Methylomirabilis lanthanidiphila TaxID=2211376 RepID=A0A564ZLV3_9BACT|nr:iron-dicitrate transporter subunit ATP-binding component of ABC superfamily; KpLE2 phage-like element [Candidatus Methylomirabilis lanthanidiphila]
MRPEIRLDSVRFTYSNGFGLSGIDLRVEPGERMAILGPNGSGKSTLLKLMLGLLHPQEGKVSFEGHDLSTMSRAELARAMAMVPQELLLPYALTVRDVVLLGRTPYLHRYRGPARKDLEAAREAMTAADLVSSADRPYNDLSGGERQRVILAMALAQQPRLLLLDEPTRSLDLNHQVGILSLIRDLTATHGLTVIASMHDLNLASLYFNRLILLSSGRIVADGPPEQVIRPDMIREVFGVSILVRRHPGYGIPWATLTPDARDLFSTREDVSEAFNP